MKQIEGRINKQILGVRGLKVKSVLGAKWSPSELILVSLILLNEMLFTPKSFLLNLFNLLVTWLPSSQVAYNLFYHFTSPTDVTNQSQFSNVSDMMSTMLKIFCGETTWLYLVCSETNTLGCASWLHCNYELVDIISMISKVVDIGKLW